MPHNEQCSNCHKEYFNNSLEGLPDDPLDVFKEYNSWLGVLNNIQDRGEQMPWVFISLPLFSSGNGEGLAGESAREDVHQSTKRFAIEGFNICPDRRRIQFSRFHLRNQVRASEGFDHHISECSAAWENSFESKPDAFVSWAKAEVINWRGSIHTILTNKSYPFRHRKSKTFVVYYLQ